MERQWIDGLTRSGLDLTVPFSANEAKHAVVTTPTKKGLPRKISPSNYKMAYVLKKSPDFYMAYRDTKGCPMFVLNDE